jgi:hypothetical protein
MFGAAAVAAPFISRNLLGQTPASAPAPAPVRTLRHASFGTSGQAWSDLQQIAGCDNVDIVAICDVDDNLAAKAREAFPKARFYKDWRVLLERERNNIDSVNVSVPDHMHAAISVTAMKMGKHIFGQKPLAHELYEVRRMRDIARETKVVTQMGIQIHSSVYYRMGVQLIQDGAIGKIKEAHSWCYKSWGDMSEKPDRSDPAPANLDWDLWLGVCAARPYIGDKYYHPDNWRKRLDFGTGTLGDMACHIFDPVFEAINLGSPIAVRSEGPLPNSYNWAINAKVVYTFAGTQFTEGSTMDLTWYDGDQRPPAKITALLEGKTLPTSGSIFVGTKGAMLLPHIATPTLYPAAQFENYQKPRVRGVNHWKQFVEACRGNDKTTTDFDYAGPLTEAVLLGGVAARFPRRAIGWNSDSLKFDLAAANQYVRRDYRKGWEVAGLTPSQAQSQSQPRTTNAIPQPPRMHHRKR